MAKTSMAPSSYKRSVFSLLNLPYSLSMESNKVLSHQDNIYPLTAFDNLYERYGVVMGWLVEGSVDPSQLGYSLDKVMDKWPLLGGRLERTEVRLCTMHVQCSANKMRLSVNIISVSLLRLAMSATGSPLKNRSGQFLTTSPFQWL